MFNLQQGSIKTVHLYKTFGLKRFILKRSTDKKIQNTECPGYYTVNLCLVIIKYKNPSWTSITVPQKYVFDFKE